MGKKPATAKGGRGGKGKQRSEDVELKRNGEIALSNEAKRILERFLTQRLARGNRNLRTVVYEARRMETLRLVLEPNKKLVVVKREAGTCRQLLQIARLKLQKKHLNQVYQMLQGEKVVVHSTEELEDGDSVWFEIVEYDQAKQQQQQQQQQQAEEASESSEEEEDAATTAAAVDEEEFDHEEEEDGAEWFARAQAASATPQQQQQQPVINTTLPKLDFARSKRERIALPIDEFERELVESTLTHSVTILSAPTGSGKSTRLPQFVLDYATSVLARYCNIIVTEPRRIAAITLAERVSQELHDDAENSQACVCGYSVRTASRLGKHTRILFCTVGVLLKRLSHDVNLESVTHVFVDEAHEQDVLTDLLLIFLRDLLATRRPDLRIVILSATMRSETFAAYFSAHSTKQIAVPGRMFPVDFYFAEELRAVMPNERRTGGGGAPEQILACIEHFLGKKKAVREVGTTVLVFVTGRRDILQTAQRLRLGLSRQHEVEILPLHSQLSNEDQRRVFAPPTTTHPSRSRIVISTNVAETSVTIPNVGLVVDCGTFKESTYDAERRMLELKPVRISRSAMMQRRGRAGRTAPGTCYHLFSSTEVLEEMPTPGMQKDSLESAMLFLKAAKRGTNAYAFFAQAPNPPPRLHVTCILEDLTQLGVLQGRFSSGGDEEDLTELTPLGFHLAKLGTSCRVGKLLLFGCLFECIEPILTIASVLDGKNPFNTFALKPASLQEIRKHFGQDDFTCFLRARQVFLGGGVAGEEVRRRFLSRSAMELNEKIRADFLQDLIAAGFLPAHYTGAKHGDVQQDAVVVNKALQICLAAGLFPHVGKITQTGIVFSTGQYALERSFFDANTTLTRLGKNEFFVYHDRVRLGVNALSLQKICAVPALALVLFAGALQRTRKQSAKLRFITFKLGACWMLRCRTRDAMLILQLRSVLNEALLEIYEQHGARTPQHKEMFTVIQSLF